MWLFGSRARGDARDDSDIDLAFEHDSGPADWAEFVNAALDDEIVRRLLADYLPCFRSTIGRARSGVGGA